MRIELTRRQREVLVGIASGENMKGISARLGIAEKTAEFHRAALMRRLKVWEVAGLTRYAVRVGYIAAALVVFAFPVAAWGQVGPAPLVNDPAFAPRLARAAAFPAAFPAAVPEAVPEVPPARTNYTFSWTASPSLGVTNYRFAVSNAAGWVWSTNVGSATNLVVRLTNKVWTLASVRAMGGGLTSAPVSVTLFVPQSWFYSVYAQTSALGGSDWADWRLLGRLTNLSVEGFPQLQFRVRAAVGLVP